MRVVPFIFNHSSEELSVTKLVILIKCLTAREVFQRSPNVKKMLWGGVLRVLLEIMEMNNAG